jgi:hypothetical protein
MFSAGIAPARAAYLALQREIFKTEGWAAPAA